MRPFFCFNSRAREGRDMTLWRKMPLLSRFNSRAREGRDWETVGVSCIIWLFQFTRPRGARRLVNWSFALLFKFQFTRPRGARPVASKFFSGVASFNSRAREGRDVRGSSVLI